MTLTLDGRVPGKAWYAVRQMTPAEEDAYSLGLPEEIRHGSTFASESHLYKHRDTGVGCGWMPDDPVLTSEELLVLRSFRRRARRFSRGQA